MFPFPFLRLLTFLGSLEMLLIILILFLVVIERFHRISHCTIQLTI